MRRGPYPNFNAASIIHISPIITLGLMTKSCTFPIVQQKSINVIVTCTNRKRGIPAPEAQLRSIKDKDLPTRLFRWTTALTIQNKEHAPALNLYIGNYWSVVREMVENTEEFGHVRFWVISAGFGLIPIERSICPYAATFSNGQPDSVLPDKPGRFTLEDWWTGLSHWHKSQEQQISCLADLAKAFPSEPLIVSLSPEYLTAVYRDLYTAREFLHNPNRLVIISSGSGKKGPLKNNFLPCDARMEHIVGVSRMALNARIIRHVLKNNPAQEMQANVLEKKYTDLLRNLPSANYPVREASTDKEVLTFIRESLLNGLPASSARLLRIYRDSGKACEQNRFRKLFLQTQESLSSKTV